MPIATDISRAIRDLTDRNYSFMHICGTHEASIARSGLRSLLPPGLKIVMGPGCPVCITPQGEIDAALELAGRGITLATYGDLLRVPGTRGSLESCGGDVRVVQGVHKAVEIARGCDGEVVFISVGFETTAPTVAAALLSGPPGNFSILPFHRLVPPAMGWLLSQGEARLDGFLLPGHVCTVSGYAEYEQFPVPQVVAGFLPEEILLGLLMLLRQVRAGEHRVENAYPRAVCREGNPKAKEAMNRVFEPCDAEWRGFPVIPGSGLRLRKEFEAFDALKKYGLTIHHVEKHTACLCDRVLRGIAQPTDCRLYGKGCTPRTPVIPGSGLRLRKEFEAFDALKKYGLTVRHVEKHTACLCDRVLRGIAQPTDCRLYGKGCTPRTPVGPCMVSHEGACRIWHTYRVKGT